ncbi:hypothetical protein K431DRAFT_299442 [Polychaeton citri CBS 116435]|uniref:Uncharacterized protein n=1 Tax=Polychaeton citri CBS 116435 TaxID=1314669 RepID=A0A9P4QFJ3_9PEZI|nr:hypothetical protein K431DRAFT_299442 [Polychaeton citri CBS 116435]
MARDRRDVTARTPGNYENVYLSEELDSENSEGESSSQRMASIAVGETAFNPALASPLNKGDSKGTGDHEIEYHTESSEASADDEEDEELDNDASGLSEGKGQEHDGAETLGESDLLPAHLLQDPPVAASPVTASAVAAYKAQPWSTLTRGEKRNARRRERAKSKKLYHQISRDAQGTGVVAAGRVAQAKRCVSVPTGASTVASGRVVKVQPQRNGRQQLLNNRKKALTHHAPRSKTRRSRR